ncbi:hypothetical protein ACVWY0_003565 [Arthrobacter sp. UYNi723]
MSAEYLPWLVGLLGGVGATLVGTLGTGWFSQRESKKAAAAAARAAIARHEQERDLAHEQWLRDQKQRIYGDFITMAEGVRLKTLDPRFTIMDEDLSSMLVARTRLRLTASVPVRRSAAEVTNALLALARDSKNRNSDGQRQYLKQLDWFIGAAREDLGTSTDEDGQLFSEASLRSHKFLDNYVADGPLTP